MYADLAGKYPFLDMVVSYTLVDECCCFLCDKIDPEFGYDKQCTCKDCIPYLDKIKKYKEVYSVSDFEAFYYSYWETDHVRSDVGNLVCLTIWIHNGQANILFGDPAISKFNEYNTLYCAPEYAFMFSSSLYRDRHTCICDKQFVEDCFESIGKPRNLCNEYVERGFISPFNENAIVVTKDWVIRQYNAYITGK